jgi:hypothetical protein
VPNGNEEGQRKYREDLTIAVKFVGTILRNLQSGQLCTVLGLVAPRVAFQGNIERGSGTLADYRPELLLPLVVSATVVGSRRVAATQDW